MSCDSLPLSLAFLSPQEEALRVFQHGQAPLTSTVGFMRVQLDRDRFSSAYPSL